jgi:hypothetical protein
MIPDSWLKIETRKFPILEGEKQEITNEGMYGKALCQYLEAKLPAAGIDAPSYCSEDWGWWLEVRRGSFKMGLCIYSEPGVEADPVRYAIGPSIEEAKKWSWSKFKKEDMSQEVLAVIDTVERILRNDAEVHSVTRHDDFPF